MHAVHAMVTKYLIYKSCDILNIVYKTSSLTILAWTILVLPWSFATFHRKETYKITVTNAEPDKPVNRLAMRMQLF